MADPVINQFEIERRVITWSPLTTLNDGVTPLGYDGDPNLVNPVGTPGEQWLYFVPIGQFYKQSNATLWWKNGAPNTWINLTSGGGGASVEGSFTGPTVSIGDAVYVSAAATVSQADATLPTGQRLTIGLCVAKPTAATATVRFAGEAAVFSGTLVAGDTYYLDTTAGSITNNVAGHTSGDAIQIVGVAKDTNTLIIQPQMIAIL
jgi:hypothetical protein